jgi:hypothetical protein
MNWPTAILVLGVLTLALSLWASIVAFRHERTKLNFDTSHVEEVRALVSRYEQLAAGTLDAQTRAAADVAELRVRTASIEQILRTVD